MSFVSENPRDKQMVQDCRDSNVKQNACVTRSIVCYVIAVCLLGKKKLEELCIFSDRFEDSM